jgi:hypothetical protein
VGMKNGEGSTGVLSWTSPRGSSGLLHLKASHASIFQPCFKTGGGAMTGGVASSYRLHRVKVEDRRVDATDRVDPLYVKIVVSMY